MTWLKGNSTWGTLGNDLTRLICGEIPDASAVTTASGDRWVREVSRSVSDGVLNSTTTVTSATAAFVAGDVGAQVYGTGIPNGATIASVTNSTTVVLSAAATASASGVALQICTDTIRTPAAKDVATGAMSNRTGYFAASNGSGMASPVTSSLKMTTPFSSDVSTGGFHRWVVSVNITAANTVAGNYSTARYDWVYRDADTGVVLNTSTSVAPSAAGVLGFSPAPAGLSATIADPSGFVTAGTVYVRAFTSTYMYGIDWWPMLYRQGATAPSFSLAPPGVAGTDYDVVALAGPPTFAANFVNERSSLFHGLGIKTATGLGVSPLYTVSHSMALIKMRIFNSATAGVLSLDVGQSKRDPLNGLSIFRNCGGFRITTWAKVFQTPASVTAGSLVQYWLSVTNDGVFVVLNADPGQTGKLGTAFIGAYTPIEPTYDVFPVGFNAQVTDYTAATAGGSYALGTQYLYWAQRRHMDGSEAPRDWQTGWMRSEHLGNGSANFTAYAGMSATDTTGYSTISGSPSVPGLTAIGVATGVASSNQSNSIIPGRQNKPAPDGKWWLYGMTYGEMANWYTSSNFATDENRFVRGTLSRFFFIPDSGWGSGDELTDTSSGAKYLLLMPDYGGAGERIQTANSTATYVGGVAVAEV